MTGPARAAAGGPGRAEEPGRDRSIRSYVLRGGRATPAQRRALNRYLPRYALPGDEAARAALDLPRAFGRAAPLVLDIGAGSGESTLSLARARPEYNLLAVEVYPAGIGRLLLGMVRQEVANIRIIRQDINAVLSLLLEPEDIDLALLWFPDPWPKKRHHKRRLVNGRFLQRLAARMKPGARAWIATDCRSYAESIRSCLAHQPLWINLAGAGRYAPRPRWLPPTRYEHRALRAGNAVYCLALARAG